jgi:hypothetical protein
LKYRQDATNDHSVQASPISNGRESAVGDCGSRWIHEDNS